MKSNTFFPLAMGIALLTGISFASSEARISAEDLTLVNESVVDAQVVLATTGGHGTGTGRGIGTGHGRGIGTGRGGRRIIGLTDIAYDQVKLPSPKVDLQS